MLTKILTPIKAIRKNCLLCQGNSYKNIRNCSKNTCVFFEYRFGKNPKRTGIGGRKKL